MKNNGEKCMLVKSMNMYEIVGWYFHQHTETVSPTYFTNMD